MRNKRKDGPFKTCGCGAGLKLKEIMWTTPNPFDPGYVVKTEVWKCRDNCSGKPRINNQTAS